MALRKFMINHFSDFTYTFNFVLENIINHRRTADQLADFFSLSWINCGLFRSFVKKFSPIAIFREFTSHARNQKIFPRRCPSDNFVPTPFSNNFTTCMWIKVWIFPLDRRMHIHVFCVFKVLVNYNIRAMWSYFHPLISTYAFK